MSKWYQPKIKYTALIEGKSKVVSEPYLFEGVNYGEVEKNCYEALRTRIKGPDVDTIAKSSLGEPVFYAGTREDSFEADPFWRVGIETGEKYVYLVPAKDAEEAISRALKFHGYGERKSVFDIKRTDILGVWHPKNELWQGDWWNRMELLLEQKKCSWDINQTSLFNADGAVDPETGEVFNKPADFVAPQETEEQRIARELDERKTNVPAVRNVGVGSVETLAVEAEDMENGVEPEHFHEARLIETPQLGPGTDINANSEQKYPAGKSKAKAKPKKEVKPKTPKRAAKRRGDWVSPTA
ncbi:DUF4494 family protein [Fibrella forsythiae]|uniref:DUF4494 family protein n=1 Tax=Fibrella forsythiae TaxID=2817061 RepID=A0ABS3JC24_9BACT|nr:DUF4494 family protein [Fibrella forsythiae]MBO0947554.1 DUF4494 family protein [Fibrella forsythiae]